MKYPFDQRIFQISNRIGFGNPLLRPMTLSELPIAIHSRIWALSYTAATQHQIVVVGSIRIPTFARTTWHVSHLRLFIHLS